MATALQNRLLPCSPPGPFSDNLFPSQDLKCLKNVKPTGMIHAPKVPTSAAQKSLSNNIIRPLLPKITDYSDNQFDQAKTNTNYDPFLSLLNPKCLSDCRQVHAHLVKLDAFGSNSLIKSKLAIMYARSMEFIDHAHKLFDEIPERTVPVYAALIGSYCRLERWVELFSVLGLMVGEAVLPDRYMMPTVLKACSAMKMMRSGKMIHGYVVRRGLESDVVVGNSLIDFYGTCEDLRCSRSVFDSMKERDVVSWTALVSAYMQEGLLDEALEVFRSMQLEGVKPDLISWNALVSGFAKNGEIGLALRYLEGMLEGGVKPQVNSWNGIISGSAQSGCFEDALNAFIRMLHLSENPNSVTIVSVLPACAGLKDFNLGRAVHGFALKCALCQNIHVEGSLIDMYSKCEGTDGAEKVFFNAKSRSTAMLNEMIAAYVNRGKMEAAVGLLSKWQKDGLNADVITYNTLLSGYARNGMKSEAYSFLSQMMQVVSRPNIITFNTLISGFQQSGLTHEALKLFRAMQSSSSVYFPSGLINVSIQPNSITVPSALAACGDLGMLCQGKEIHGYMLRNYFESSVYVSSALVDMYAKCHDMVSAAKVFRRIEERNTICWNSLLAGYINNMQPEMAHELFREMIEEGTEPSSVTFMLLLPACGDMAAGRLGRELHGYITKIQFCGTNTDVVTALISMYTNCGCVREAKLISDSIVKGDALESDITLALGRPN